MRKPNGRPDTPRSRASRIDLYKKSTYRKRNEKPKEALGTTLRLIGYLREETPLVILTILLLTVQTGIGLASSLVYRDMIDNIERGILRGFITLIATLAFLYVSNAVINFVSGYIMNGVSQRTLKKMRKHIFEKLQILSISFFDRNRDGDLMSRITNDVDNISNTMTHSVIQFVESIITLLGTLGFMIYMSWELTLVTMVTVPLIYVAAKTIARFSRKRHRQLRYEIGALNGFIAEQIDGAKVIQSFVQEEQIIDEFTYESKRVTRTTIIASTLSSIMGPAMEFLGNIRYIVIIIGGAMMIANGVSSVTVGTITAFVELANRFSRPLNQLANLYTDIQNALSGAERIFEILDDQSIIPEDPEAIPLENVKGTVELRNVTFSYVEGQNVLKNISIKAYPGQKIALVGHTGAGKTTIINLIMRFYDVEEGEVLIDGVNIKKYTIDSLLNHVGIVLQDTHLFSGTIKENIRYGRLDATDEEIIEACKAANCHHFIMQLPEGYDTMLAPNGSNLSEGQRQLLSIARTLLRNPDILILDEATSNVDTMTERYITEAIDRLTANRTSFIIAHRLSTIRNCDLIIVMQGGEIIEQGSHDELVNKKGIYYQLLNAKPDDALLNDFELLL
ncbi:MAG TPA: ABC transporter ATP-binding protein [Haloplasmataceae bacterium]